ncbi:MAG TPA: 4Fe-4S binding protein [Candidatus Avidehalobacter gallistercoris]|uniref:4Fe-4S binding protein n=1 Tax=Candidatus Avidehalobacter gallistercoris TaxID=2840694 RepID=A0A9D1HK32_9FIRM|nr:4Fe-4S binding protein [Candidatus Avidehalobacter gallistercoris]
MKRVYVQEQWCLACHLCEYACAFVNSGQKDMSKALKGVKINPCIRIEERGNISFAVNCRHCEEPLCLKSCISGAISVKDGVVHIDQEKCVGCYTCVLACPYGAIMPANSGKVMQKCELEMEGGEPACVAACPNRAIVFEER